MKLQLDTTNKTIKLESNVKLSELVKTLDKLLPNKEWKEFTLETNTVINNWNNPFYFKEIIKETPVYPKRYYESPWICTTGRYYATSSKSNYELKSGTYNIEC